MDISEMAFKWFGQAVNLYEGSIKETRKHLPLFKRDPFGNNNYLDVILRNPYSDYRLDERLQILGSS